VLFANGDICLDVLKDGWSPVWTLESVGRAIIVLLSNPEASSPLNCDAGNLIRAGDMRGFLSLARMYTLEHAEMLTETTEEGSEPATTAVVTTTPSI
jgi:ubiquitin-protein ligase